MNENDLCNLYAASLVSMYLKVDDNDAVCYGVGSEAQVQIEGVNLYLPTESKLDSKKHADDAFFHPLCEDALHGQSQMIHFLTRRTTAAMSLRLDMLVGEILTLAANTERQSKIKNSKAMEFLIAAKDMTDNTLKSWQTLIKKMTDHGGAFSVYLNRNQSIDGTHYARVCVLDVPIIRDTHPDAKLCGISVQSKANKEVITKLVNKIFDGVELEFGSNERTPYYHALMTMYVTVMRRLNAIADLFKKSIDHKQLDLGWYDDMFGTNYAELCGIIPPLAYNMGIDSKSARTTETEKSGKDVEGADVPWVAPKPAAPRGGGISLDDLDGGRKSRDLSEDRENDRYWDSQDRNRRDRDRDRDRDYDRDYDRDRSRRRSRVSDAFSSRRDRDRDYDRDYDRDDRRDRDRDRGRSRGITLDDLDD